MNYTASPVPVISRKSSNSGAARERKFMALAAQFLTQSLEKEWPFMIEEMETIAECGRKLDAIRKRWDEVRLRNRH